MNRLTSAEEEIMLILWELEECTVRDVINKITEPNIPYTTVSTVIRILEKKNFVSHRAIGNTYLYRTIISQEEYANQSLSGLLNKYFEGSFTNLASFFASENDISMRDLREMMQEVKEDLREDKKESKQERKQEREQKR